MARTLDQDGTSRDFVRQDFMWNGSSIVFEAGRTILEPGGQLSLGNVS
jgi:hypothetical protein